MALIIRTYYGRCLDSYDRNQIQGLRGDYTLSEHLWLDGGRMVRTVAICHKDRRGPIYVAGDHLNHWPESITSWNDVRNFQWINLETGAICTLEDGVIPRETPQAFPCTSCPVYSRGQCPQMPVLGKACRPCEIMISWLAVKDTRAECEALGRTAEA